MCDPQHYGHNALLWPMIPGPFAPFNHELSLPLAVARLWFVVQLLIHNRFIEHIFVGLFMHLATYTHMPGTDGNYN